MVANVFHIDAMRRMVYEHRDMLTSRAKILQLIGLMGFEFGIDFDTKNIESYKSHKYHRFAGCEVPCQFMSVYMHQDGKMITDSYVRIMHFRWQTNENMPWEKPRYQNAYHMVIMSDGQECDLIGESGH